jgi:signal transduction histidine kinase
VTRVPRPYRRALLIYVATIVLPTCALVGLGVQSFRRQDDDLSRLRAEKLVFELERRTLDAATKAFDDPRHPLVRYFFRLDGGILVEPALESAPTESAPPEFREAEYQALTLGRPDLALRSYQTLLRSHPAKHLARARIARSLTQLGREREAREVWRSLATESADELDLSHRPYGIVAAMHAGDTDGLVEQIEAGRWTLPGDQAEFYLSTLAPGRESFYLDRFAFARQMHTDFSGPRSLAEGEIRSFRLGERLAFYRSAGPGELEGLVADTGWVNATLRPAVERDLPVSGSVRLLYGGAVSLVMLILSAGVVLLWRDVSREVRASRLRSDMVSGVTHELKTPITLVRLYGETLLLRPDLDDEARKDAYRVITRESARLGRLIDQVLSYSRVERGEGTYELESGDIGPVVHGVMDDYREWLERAGFTVSWSRPEVLPPVRFDPAALSQAVINLLDNAVKYSGSSRSIDVRLTSDERHVTFEVEDRGIGIPADEQSRIFDRFYRAANGSGKGGYGLGLFMVRHIVQAHGGEVSVRSGSGQGSTFEIRLPTLPS